MSSVYLSPDCASEILVGGFSLKLATDIQNWCAQEGIGYSRFDITGMNFPNNIVYSYRFWNKDDAMMCYLRFSQGETLSKK